MASTLDALGVPKNGGGSSYASGLGEALDDEDYAIEAGKGDEDPDSSTAKRSQKAARENELQAFAAEAEAARKAAAAKAKAAAAKADAPKKRGINPLLKVKGKADSAAEVAAPEEKRQKTGAESGSGAAAAPASGGGGGLLGGYDSDEDSDE
eukprot:TRINITY_DN105798_c0_g1_i1.p3 TRINITY_DN105798_c0_g1~~TRINITY_DN105798_c0_g1_i1.p3  ORF type:complete len:152 (-),score=58.84 TRINITY_DN105798_c0_g1_i1:170-625(-)